MVLFPLPPQRHARMERAGSVRTGRRFDASRRTRALHRGRIGTHDRPGVLLDRHPMTARNPLACGKTSNPPIYRVLAKTKVTESGCWEYTGSKDGNGYGYIKTGSRKDGTRRNRGAHRVSYEHFVAPIPDDLVIDHLCRNPPCVNPDHLEVVTTRENVMRGVSPWPVLGRNNVCKRGHSLLDPEHGAYRKDGHRWCRTCNKLRKRKDQRVWRTLGA